VKPGIMATGGAKVLGVAEVKKHIIFILIFVSFYTNILLINRVVYMLLVILPIPISLSKLN